MMRKVETEILKTQLCRWARRNSTFTVRQTSLVMGVSLGIAREMIKKMKTQKLLSGEMDGSAMKYTWIGGSTATFK